MQLLGDRRTSPSRRNSVIADAEIALDLGAQTKAEDTTMLAVCAVTNRA
jgi:hypothetical protein